MIEKKGITFHSICQNIPNMGGAMRTGISMATGSHIIVLDAGGATNPKLIGDMILLSKKYPNDIIKASRYLNCGGFDNNYPFLKKIWNLISQLIISLYYCTKFMDFTYNYSCVPSIYYHNILWVETMHPFNMECTLKWIRLGVNIRECIPTVQLGGSSSGYRETIGYLMPMLKIRFMRKNKLLKAPIQVD
jgi:glycosyltransferase involved in cell wall biosynthesis